MTVLHARELPSGPGGATSFLDMRAAYRRLDPDDRARLVGLRAVHATTTTERSRRGHRPADRSNAWRRSRTPSCGPTRSRVPRAFYFDLDRARGIEGMPDAEGRPLLQGLQTAAEQGAPRYDHPWRPHDVLVWDNASVQHKAGGDFPVGEPRRFWRYMVAGEVPVAYLPG